MLTVVIGCMFSSKTTHVVRLGKRYRAIGKNILFIDHSSDTRYSETHLVSHDGDKEKCIFLEKLFDIFNSSWKELYDDADVIIIEEGQFFPDLLSFIEKETDEQLHKDFIVSGLSGDFQRKPIGDILRIIPLAEHVIKLNGFCQSCKDGTAGTFTKRIVELDNQILVGGKDSYECVCRKHFLES